MKRIIFISAEITLLMKS